MTLSRILRFIFLLVFALAPSMIDGQETAKPVKFAPTVVFPTDEPISGRVVDRNGNPIFGAVICHGVDNLEDTWRAGSATSQPTGNESVVSGPLGYFEFTSIDVSIGRHFAAYHNEYLLKWVNPLELFGEVVLDQGTRLRGQVVDHAGNPVVDAELKLQVWPRSRNIPFEIPNQTTDQDGKFEFDFEISQESSIFFVVTTNDGDVAHFGWRPFKPDLPLDDGPGNVAIGMEPVLRLPKPDRFRFVVADETGARIQVSSIAYGIKRYAQLPSDFFEIGSDGANQIDRRFLPGSPFFVRVEPAQESGLVPMVKLIDPSEAEREFKFKPTRGAILTGRVVDSETGKPVVAAAVHFVPDEPGPLFQADVTHRAFVRSNDNGQFRITVPAVSGKLVIAGNCFGYHTLPVHDRTQLSEWGASVLERVVDPSPGETLTVDTFRLVACPRVAGTVVDENDQPVAGVKYAFASFGAKPEFGVTDSSGRFEIKSALSDPSERMLPESNRGNQGSRSIVIQFWQDRFARNQSIDLINIEPQEWDKLKVSLQPSQAALGRVIDGITKEPVAGVLVSSSDDIGTGSAAVVGTTTNSRGEFFLEHLAPSTKYLAFQKRAYQSQKSPVGERQGVQLRDLPLVVELRDFEIYQTFAFGEPGPPPEFDPDDVMGSLAKTIEYMRLEMQKLPDGVEFKDMEIGLKRVTTRFERALLKKMEPLVQHLNHPAVSESDRVASAISIAEIYLHDRDSAFMHLPTAETVQRIIERNLDVPGAFKAYVQLGFQADSNRNYVELMKLTETRRPKEFLLNMSLNRCVANLISGAIEKNAQGRMADDEFEDLMRESEFSFRMALEEFTESSIPEYPEMTKANLARQYLTMINKKVSGPGVDPSRAKRIQEWIKSLPDESR